MQITKMAWRNVWRNTRRSCVTIGAMAFSLLMMILATSFYEGFLKKMEANIIEVEIGDIQIHQSNYRDKPSIYNTIADSMMNLSNYSICRVHSIIINRRRDVYEACDEACFE